MSTDPRRVSALPLGMASLGIEQRSAPFEPNWIDFRHSLVVVDLRIDKGETPKTCDECGCEIDISPAPHSPKCSTITTTGKVARRNGRHAVDGRELLEQMDAGERIVAPDLDDDDDLDAELEEAPAPDEMGPDGVASSSSSDSEEPTIQKRAKRAAGELLAEVLELLADGPMRLSVLAGRIGYTSTNLGGWLIPHVKAGRIIKVERGVYALPEESEREPQAATEGADADTRLAVADPPDDAGEEPSRSEHEGRRRAWDRDDILDAIRRWDAEYGHPPTSTEWMRRVDGYPTTTTVASRFGSWANAIEQAGFPRPTRGGVPLQPLRAPAKRVRVRGTGLLRFTPSVRSRARRSPPCAQQPTRSSRSSESEAPSAHRRRCARSRWYRARRHGRSSPRHGELEHRECRLRRVDDRVDVRRLVLRARVGLVAAAAMMAAHGIRRQFVVESAPRHEKNDAGPRVLDFAATGV